MRVVTFNANGLRSAARKGFFSWFARQRADVLCVQELKAHDAQIAERAFHARGYTRVCVRIDYQVVSPALGAAVRSAAIYKRRRFSDHAPLTIDYDWALT